MAALGLTILLLIIQAGVATAQTQRTVEAQDVFSVLKELAEIPTGFASDDPAQLKPRVFLPSWTKPEIDSRGNLIVTFGSGDEHLFFVAHLDEVAYVVKRINDNGTLTVERRGGLHGRYYEARPVLVYTAHGAVSAVINDLHVFLGTESRRETEDLGIKAGDSITVPKRFTQLPRGRLTNRLLDERSGCTAMLLALMSLDPAKVKKRVTFVWTVEDRVDWNVARALAEKSSADYVFAVNAVVPSGYVIRTLDTNGHTPPLVIDRVMDIARRYNIQAQTGTGENDSSTVTQLHQTNLEALTEIIRQLVLEF
jgi:putative aminopeptidase FrvX